MNMVPSFASGSYRMFSGKVGNIITIQYVYKSKKPPYFETIEGEPPKGRELKQWEIIKTSDSGIKMGNLIRG